MTSIIESLSRVPNFPKKGVDFIDMSPVMADPILFQELVSKLTESLPKSITDNADKILAIESRGFILGAALAERLKKGLVMVRKKGKLPGPVFSHSYKLEYGTDTLEIQKGSLKSEDKVLIVDDVLATGGTARATHELCKELGVQVLGLLCFIEIEALGGRNLLDIDVISLHRE